MTKGIEALRKQLKAFQGLSVEAGFFETAKYDDGTPVASVATIHEFGLGNVPARPFMRVAEAESRKAIINLVAKGAVAVADGRMTPDAVFERVGGLMRGAIQDAIAHGAHTPLSGATISAKGFATPLVDTARMLQSVTHRVQK